MILPKRCSKLSADHYKTTFDVVNKYMTSKFLTFLLLALCFYFPTNAVADINDQALQRAQKYLSNLDTLKANFHQISPFGDITTGKFYLDRPGKLRFEYDDPLKDFIVADGTFIFYYDAALDQQSNTLISQTPADFILRQDLNLSGDIQVNNVSLTDGLIAITVSQKEDPLSGQLTLGFQAEPFELVRWAIEDNQGGTTEIILSNIERNTSLEGIKFYYQHPDFGKKPRYNQ